MTPSVTSQKADTRRTLEVTCWPWLGCWSNNIANSHSNLVHSTSEYCAPVWCCGGHTCHLPSMTPCALWLDAFTIKVFISFFCFFVWTSLHRVSLDVLEFGFCTLMK